MTYTITRDGKVITLDETECEDIFRRMQKVHWREDLVFVVDSYAEEYEEQAPGLADWLKAHVDDALDTFERRLEAGWRWDDAAHESLNELAEDYEEDDA